MEIGGEGERGERARGREGGGGIEGRDGIKWEGRDGIEWEGRDGREDRKWRW